MWDDEPDPLDTVDCVVFDPEGPKMEGRVYHCQSIYVQQSRCTETQRRRLGFLKLEIGYHDDEWQERLGAYCKRDMRDLSYDEAADLEEKLERRLRDHGTLYEKRARQLRRMDRE